MTRKFLPLGHFYCIFTTVIDLSTVGAVGVYKKEQQKVHNSVPFVSILIILVAVDINTGMINISLVH